MLLKDKSIFIVEDNTQNRVVFHMSLVRHGALVEFERWGEGAVMRLKTTLQVDLIVLDLMLAFGVTGFDVYDQIRAIPRFCETPIIAVSAMDPSIAIPKVMAKGFCGFIAKPIDGHLFPKQIASVIAGEKIWHAGARI